jgi:hypothetical protein
VDLDAYLALQARKNLTLQVDTSSHRPYSDEVPHMVFQTVWRTESEGGVPMKITATEDTIEVKRNTEPKPNEFLAMTGTGKAAKSVIQAFVDAGKTQKVELEPGDSLTGTIDRLRVAAKSVGKGVRIAIDGDRKTSRSFRFELIAPVVRQSKADKEAAEAAATEAATAA